MFEISVVCHFATNPAATRDFTIPHNSQFFTILRRLSAKARASSPIGITAAVAIEIWQVEQWDVSSGDMSRSYK